MSSNLSGQQSSRGYPSMQSLRAFDTRKTDVPLVLRVLGADEYDLMLPETHCLPRLLEPDETIIGVVYGKYRRPDNRHMQHGRGMLVVTDRRILLVDKKPLFLHFDDIKFAVVSGVAYNKAGIGETVTLNTRLGPIYIRTFNQKCAQQFVHAVEQMLFSPYPGPG